MTHAEQIIAEELAQAEAFFKAEVVRIAQAEALYESEVARIFASMSDDIAKAKAQVRQESADQAIFVEAYRRKFAA